MTASRPVSYTLEKPETNYRDLSFSSSSSFSSSFQSIRSFFDDHSLQFRRDSHHVRRLRHKNMMGYFKLQQQNAILTVLRKSISTGVKASQRQSCKRFSFCFPVGLFNKTRKDATKHNQAGDCPRCSFSQTCFKRKNRQADESHDDACTREMLMMYIKAIDNVQRLFRRVRWVKLRDDFIKNSTIPVLTFQNDITSPGPGLISYSDRLLHAAYLDELIQQCLNKQEYLLSKATNKTTAAMLGVRLYKMAQ